MKYKNYGNSTFKISEIGIGGHREGMETKDGILRNARFFRTAQERAEVVGHAIDNGVTYFDTTFDCEIESLGQSFRILKKREGLFASAMRVDFFGNFEKTKDDLKTYTRREVENSLKKFGFDYVDQFMLGAIERGNPIERSALVEDTLDIFSSLHDEGKIGKLGFSSHDCGYAARFLERFPDFNSVMVPYSFANRSAESSVARAVQKTGAAWIVMKALVWYAYGIPVTVLKKLSTVPKGIDLSYSTPIAKLALQFVLQNPYVTSCVPAMNTIEAVNENVSASGAGQLTDEELFQLNAYNTAMTVNDSVPLAIAGLLEENLRVRACSMGHVAKSLGINIEEIDWADDNAEEKARVASENLLNKIKKNKKYSYLIN